MARFGLGHILNRKKTIMERRTKRRTPHSPLSILIVDDSSTVVYALRKVLEQDGYHILVAGDGAEAIKATEIYQPDLILMDVVMPGMNGFQATRHIRKLPVAMNTPIIIISGSEQKTEQFWLRKLGANDFIAKPILRGQLFTAIEKYLFPQVA